MKQPFVRFFRQFALCNRFIPHEQQHLACKVGNMGRLHARPSVQGCGIRENRRALSSTSVDSDGGQGVWLSHAAVIQYLNIGAQIFSAQVAQ